MVCGGRGSGVSPPSQASYIRFSPLRPHEASPFRPDLQDQEVTADSIDITRKRFGETSCQQRPQRPRPEV